MTNIKNFPFIFLLGTALPIFCMEPAPSYPLCDDGEQWAEAVGGEDLKQFEGILFAFRYRSYQSGFVSREEVYSIHPPTCYGILTKGANQSTLLDHLGMGRGLHRVYLIDKQRNFNMRRLTLEEACALNGLHQEENRNFREMLKCLYPSEIPAPGALFKLKHLTPKQQRHYVKKHFKSRLALCSLHKKRKSPVNRLPKDILRLIAQQVIDLEVQSKSEMVLKLE